MINKVNSPIYEQNNVLKNKKKTQNFKGLGTATLGGLRFLNNSPAIGACAVDFCSMVAPRTIIEFKNRGTQSGLEAFFRECTSCIIHACVGVIGWGAAILTSNKFNKKHQIQAHNIFAGTDTIKNMSKLWQDSNGQSTEFFKKFLSNIKGLNGTEWKGISNTANASVIGNLEKLAAKTAELSTKSGKDKHDLKKQISDLKNLIIAQITQNTGAQSTFKLNSIKDASGNTIQKGVNGSLSELIDNAVLLSNAFKTKSLSELPDFVKSLSKNKVIGAMLGLAVCAAMVVSVQPLNRYMTKKRTGSDGFVGVNGENNEKKKPPKWFKPLKTALGIGFPVFALRTIGKPSEILSKVQFNSRIPTINQFKLLYGLTIGSRFLSARDENELRESTIKDTLGFTNWLILGGMVSKLSARAIGGKELINNPIKEEGKKGIKYAFKWLVNASVKSYDEILLPNAQNVINNGKAAKFKDLYKNADKTVKSQINKIGIAQVAGYLYSALVLGIGISKLNIFITRKVQGGNKNSQTANKFGYIDNLMKNINPVFKDFT